MTKKNFCVGRCALLAPLMAGALLLCSAQAHAAHWIMSWTAKGTSVANGTSNWADDIKWQRNYDAGSKRVVGLAEFHRDVYQEQRYPERGYSSYSYDDDYLGYWRGLSASSNGSITVYLNWVQDAGDESVIPPPKMVFLHFKGYGSAKARSTGTARQR